MNRTVKLRIIGESNLAKLWMLQCVRRMSMEPEVGSSITHCVSRKKKPAYVVMSKVHIAPKHP